MALDPGPEPRACSPGSPRRASPTSAGTTAGIRCPNVPGPRGRGASRKRESTGARSSRSATAPTVLARCASRPGCTGVEGRGGGRTRRRRLPVHGDACPAGSRAGALGGPRRVTPHGRTPGELTGPREGAAKLGQPVTSTSDQDPRHRHPRRCSITCRCLVDTCAGRRAHRSAAPAGRGREGRRPWARCVGPLGAQLGDALGLEDVDGRGPVRVGVQTSMAPTPFSRPGRNSATTPRSHVGGQQVVERWPPAARISAASRPGSSWMHSPTPSTGEHDCGGVSQPHRQQVRILAESRWPPAGVRRRQPRRRPRNRREHSTSHTSNSRSSSSTVSCPWRSS